MQLVVGRITRPHGVRGEVSVEVHTDEPDRRFAVGSALTTDPAEAGPLTVASARWHTGRLLVGFAGITDRNQAESLRGIWLTLDSAQAGTSDDPDEFHDHELIGLAVVTVSGEPVGRVADVRHFGQDLLVIEPAGPGDAAPTGTRPATAGPSGTGPATTGPGKPGRPAQPAQPGLPAQSAGPASARSGDRGPGDPGEVPPESRAGVRLPGPAPLLVPFVSAIVPEVDLAAGRLVIDPPPGLLELGTPEPGRG